MGRRVVELPPTQRTDRASRDPRGNGVLHVEDRREVLIEALRPQLLSVRHAQQSHRYSQPIAATLQRTFEYRIDAQLATRRNRILVERRIAAHRAQRADRSRRLC